MTWPSFILCWFLCIGTGHMGPLPVWSYICLHLHASVLPPTTRAEPFVGQADGRERCCHNRLHFRTITSPRGAWVPGSAPLPRPTLCQVSDDQTPPQRSPFPRSQVGYQVRSAGKLETSEAATGNSVLVTALPLPGDVWSTRSSGDSSHWHVRSVSRSYGNRML